MSAARAVYSARLICSIWSRMRLSRSSDAAACADLMSEILIEVAEHADIKSAQAAASLERLKRIRDQIEQIKRAEYTARAADIETQVAELRLKGGGEYTR